MKRTVRKEASPLSAQLLPRHHENFSFKVLCLVSHRTAGKAPVAPSIPNLWPQAVEISRETHKVLSSAHALCSAQSPPAAMWRSVLEDRRGREVLSEALTSSGKLSREPPLEVAHSMQKKGKSETSGTLASTDTGQSWGLR